MMTLEPEAPTTAISRQHLRNMFKNVWKLERAKYAGVSKSDSPPEQGHRIAVSLTASGVEADPSTLDKAWVEDDLFGPSEAAEATPLTQSPSTGELSGLQIRDPEQAWFWSERWQKMEAEADKALAEGDYKRFENVRDLLADLNEEE